MLAIKRNKPRRTGTTVPVCKIGTTCKRKCTEIIEDNYLEEEVIREIGLAMAKKSKNRKTKLRREKRVEEGEKESESKKNSLPANANERKETESMKIEESITMRERGEEKNLTK